MKSISDERRKKKAIILLVISAVCFCVPISGVQKTWARFVVSTVANAEIEVAKPILNISVDTPSGKIDPGNSITVDFHVKNFDGENNLSEVSLEYFLQFSNFGDAADKKIPVSYSLKNKTTGTTIALDARFKTVDAISVPLEKTTHDYTLTITWDSTTGNSESLIDIANTLNIVADVKQSWDD